MPNPAPETLGPYRVRSLIGQAGQTVVYQAEDPHGRPVAVKIFPSRLSADPAAVERFHRELAAAAPVSHHLNLVQVIETGQEGDRLYVAMELVDGISLNRVLRERRLSLPEAFAVMRGLSRALAHAHQHGLVHRGLTPRNILVSSDFSVVKLADLGAIGFESAAGPGLTATLSTGEIRLGALYYLAPEVVEARGAADARADLYSAGVIFHEMLTGRTPGLKFALPSQLNSELSSDLDAVVLRCLTRQPEGRYASAGDLLDDLGRLEETLRLRVLTEIRGISQVLSGVPSEAGGKKTFLYLGLALVVLALLVVGYLVLR